MKKSFQIPYPQSPKGKKDWNTLYGLNAIYAGKHWTKRKKDCEYWHLVIMAELKKQKVEKELFRKSVTLTFYWNDRLDLSNHAYMGKMIEDALRGYLLEDDSRKYVKEIRHRWHEGNHILVEIEDTSF